MRAIGEIASRNAPDLADARPVSDQPQVYGGEAERLRDGGYRMGSGSQNCCILLRPLPAGAACRERTLKMTGRGRYRAACRREVTPI
jgi:hypothetical protein